MKLRKSSLERARTIREQAFRGSTIQERPTCWGVWPKFDWSQKNVKAAEESFHEVVEHS